MQYLLDSGILLRVVNRDDSSHSLVRAAIRRLKADGHATTSSPQNLAEFWNVCTRPATARGGLGLSVAETGSRLRLAERIAPVIPDSPNTYTEWKRLVHAYGVMGVQVHDARLVAFMLMHGMKHILTLNVDDFRRYGEITPVHPSELIQTVPHA